MGRGSCWLPAGRTWYRPPWRKPRTALEEAAKYTGREGPAAQFLVAGLQRPVRDGDYVGAQLSAAEHEADPFRWPAAAAGRLSAEGAAHAQSVALQSPDPRADLVALATDWAVSEAIVGADDDAEALEKAGIEVHRIFDPAAR